MKMLFTKKFLVTLLMGLSSGIPFFVIGPTLQAWMTDAKVDLSLIGLFSLVGLPYTLKFLWSPFLDRYSLPFLGRRRGWLFVIQLLLVISIIAIAQIDPNSNLMLLGIASLLIAFFSASQDIVIDALRTESLEATEVGFGVAYYIYGYRIAKVFAEALALYLADQVSWSTVYIIISFGMLIGVFATFIATEPSSQSVSTPRTLREAVIDPFKDFFKRRGVRNAVYALAFILLYKIGDNMAISMTTPFVLGQGFTKTHVAAIGKTLGLFATLAGAFVGGLIVFRLGIYRSLWIGGVLQALCPFFFILLLMNGQSLWLLALAITYEYVSAAIGTSAYSAFMASLTNQKFTATQYALFSSLMGVPRVILSAPTGWIASQAGWGMFYVICTLMAIPGMLLLFKVKSWMVKSEG